MYYGSSSYLRARRRYYLEQSRYDIAVAVLYAIAFLGGLFVTALAFIKLKCGGLRHGVATWIRVACVLFTLYCILSTCAFALISPLAHQTGVGQQEYTKDRFRRQQDAAQYVGIISSWFHNVTQGLIFIGIMSFCAVTSTRTGSKGCLIVAYVLGGVLNGLAAAVFAMSVKQYYDLVMGRDMPEPILTLRDVMLAFNCILAAAALFAAGFAVARLSRSIHTNGRSSKLTVLSSILLLLSALYQLAVHVEISWIYRSWISPPNYLLILGVILDAWALLGALTLLTVAGKK
ncbi:hypothetical protein IF1G_00969 [Cordyceps javanica]|uniref:Uncharacterized protein n=1 Tax=Cordyceps javanica TaxID=43265 RepID=A0A545VH31_9HYPO|nr:hypothetical protein IF1G_00969 [Cordyceps javanica]TQW12199.1 hypothetical protein IF2G_00930 [Cordyceps javanica]